MTSRGNAIAIAMIAAEIVAHLSWPGSEYLQRTSPGRATSLKRLKVPPGCADIFVVTAAHPLDLRLITTPVACIFTQRH